MANPQKENGYTPIANEILEFLAKTQLNGSQRRILDVIFRFTYGYNRKEHDLSEAFIAAATAIHKKQVQRELNELIEFKIVLVSKEATFHSPRILEFNKNYDCWQVTKKLPGSEKDTHTGSELVTPRGSQKVTQQRKYKDNIKDTRKQNSNTSLITFYCNEYKTRFGNPYMPNWGRDGKIIKEFLDSGYTEEYMQKYITWYLNCNDEYLNKNGYTITLLKTRIEKYHLTLNQPPSKYKDRTGYKPGE